MSLSSEEVNFLVWRYLLESGFVHSAFAFGHESGLDRNQTDITHIPPGALVSFIQKGLLYSEIEKHVHEDGTETICENEFSVLEPHTCESSATTRHIFAPHEPLDEDYGSLEARFDDIVQLRGHRDMVTAVAWSPTEDVIVSASGDGTSRMWDLKQEAKGEDGSRSAIRSLTSDVVVKIKPPPNRGGRKQPGPASPEAAALEAEVASNNAVVGVDWKNDGSQMACACFDGRAFVYSRTGELKRTLARHRGPITCVKWSPKGALLATAGVDNSVVVWDAVSGHVKQRWEGHKGPVLDLCWRNSNSLVTSGADAAVCVWTLGQRQASHTFQAHLNDVNAVVWHKDGTHIASCSDDGTVKVWKLGSPAAVRDYSEHEREVTAVAWAPAPTALPDHSAEQKHVLASASVDTTVKLWTLGEEKSVVTLKRHCHPVTLLEFSPNGEYLATGSHDRVHLWEVKTASLVKTFKCDSGLNSLRWDPQSTRLAVSLEDSMAAVVHITD